MYTTYKDSPDNFEFHRQRCSHFAPHIHNALECVYVEDGTLELGMGTDLFHMEKGDFGIIFPGVIHHYQVFSRKKGHLVYFLASPALAGSFTPLLQTSCPENPVVPAQQVHPDIVYALKTIEKAVASGAAANAPHHEVLRQAYTQIILARALPCYTLQDKGSIGSDDLIYRMVCYIAENYTENVTLTDMAESLYVSPYVLSRTFSQSFHTNFNGYLNSVRLDHARYMLENTDLSITQIGEDSGFNSQRTFHRTFQERYHVSPRDFRKALLSDNKGELSESSDDSDDTSDEA